jgi:hypothetical protein
MTNQAYTLRMLRSYIHILHIFTYIYIYIYIYVLQHTINKYAHLFTDGYKITAKDVV